MLVVVIAVHGVEMAVVQVVDVVTVGDGLMAAARAVPVRMVGVGEASRHVALVPVVVVGVMQMAVVDVVDVVAVHDRGMAAIGAVHVGMFVRRMFVRRMR